MEDQKKNSGRSLKRPAPLKPPLLKDCKCVIPFQRLGAYGGRLCPVSAPTHSRASRMMSSQPTVTSGSIRVKEVPEKMKAAESLRCYSAAQQSAAKNVNVRINFCNLHLMLYLTTRHPLPATFQRPRWRIMNEGCINAMNMRHWPESPAR